MLDIHNYFEYNIHKVNNLKYFRVFLLAESFLLLVSGVLIYLFFRSGTFIHEFATELMGFNFEKPVLLQENLFYDFLRYYFVDFLWLASFFNAYLAVRSRVTSASILGSFIVAFLTGIIYELLQCFGIISGTFDLVDIIMYLTAGIISAAVNIFYMKARRLL